MKNIIKGRFKIFKNSINKEVVDDKFILKQLGNHDYF
jgi:hypothetical protein